MKSKTTPNPYANRYWISVILNRPMRFDTRVDLNFTIKTDLNLNDFPELKVTKNSVKPFEIFKIFKYSTKKSHYIALLQANLSK